MAAAPEYWHLVDGPGNRGRLYDGNNPADAMAAWSKAISEGISYVTLESLRKPAPAPVCDGFAGIACTERAVWLLTYECPVGHTTYLRNCESHDGELAARGRDIRTCGHEMYCVRESVLISRIQPKR